MIHEEQSLPSSLSGLQIPCDAIGPSRDVDGVILFGGEDWWYHNRGHFDMRMGRELSAHTPVIYVNSVGMRTPRPLEGAMFFQRIARKIRSLRRGVVIVEDAFGVFSPVVPPAGMGGRFWGWTLARQVRRAARRLGIEKPLLWVACPPTALALNSLGEAPLVYQRTSRFEEYPGVSKSRVKAWDTALKSKADLTIFCSRLLVREEVAQCRRARYVDHGVDFERFAAAGRKPVDPPDLAKIGRPRVGFVGGVDAHTFDPALFLEAARQLPSLQFVVVGGSSLREGWASAQTNVHLLGQRPYESVPAYMAACDVLIMPWAKNEWIRACNPVKLKEYLAVGRPVVSTPFAELESYAGYVRVTSDTAEFVASIAAAARSGHDASRLRAKVQSETWAAKATVVVEELRHIGVRLTWPKSLMRKGEARVGHGYTKG